MNTTHCSSNKNKKWMDSGEVLPLSWPLTFLVVLYRQIIKSSPEVNQQLSLFTDEPLKKRRRRRKSLKPQCSVSVCENEPGCNSRIRFVCWCCQVNNCPSLEQSEQHNHKQTRVLFSPLHLKTETHRLHTNVGLVVNLYLNTTPGRLHVRHILSPNTFIWLFFWSYKCSKHPTI